MSIRTTVSGIAVLAVVLLGGLAAKQTIGAESPPNIVSVSKPQAGDVQIIFHGTAGPFQIQKRNSVDASAAWYDLIEAKVIEIQAGVFLASIPMGTEDKAFYRIMKNDEVIAELKGWSILVQALTPANGSYFVKGETPVITVNILDNFAQGITRETFSTLSLYMHGPQDPRRTVTPARLLNASTNRSVQPHHYINLRTNANVQVNGSQLTYALQPVADEDPGTYTVSVNAVLGSDPIQQIMKFANLQIGTPTPETNVVSKASCIPCHQGTISGKMYMHHADPGRSPTGSWALDYNPVDSCKACHNNDGYASYSDPSAPGGRVPDAIVLRVHGVHMGERLSSDFNTNTVTGNFRDYTHGVFPANITNSCTVCHQDDRWQTTPTRQACGSCHDNIWFGSVTATNRPAGAKDHDGGSQTTDNRCALCHEAESIAEDHQAKPPTFQLSLQVSRSDPANGKFYVAGEKPLLSIKVLDAITGVAYKATNIVDPLVSTNPAATDWRRANLMVAGPRADTIPVLTTAATNTTASYANNDVRYLRDPNKRDPRATWQGETILYQLDDVAGLAPGTYTVYAEFAPSILPAGVLGGRTWLNFQVGTTNIEPQIAGGCLDCHGAGLPRKPASWAHTGSRAVPMITDVCKVCHDNLHQMSGKTNWANSQYGFGVSPISRRVHGIHFGNYLNKPDENTSGIANVIFPQDVRNCTKCHTESPSWNTKPSRLACLACHDSTMAKVHSDLMTFDPTPADPWNGDEEETCILCHGQDSAFSASKVHAISNPYVPPYPRAPRGE